MKGHGAFAFIPLDPKHTHSGGPVTASVRERHAARLRRGLHKYWVVTMWKRGTTARSNVNTITATTPVEAAKKIQARKGAEHQVVKVEEMW